MGKKSTARTSIDNILFNSSLYNDDLIVPVKISSKSITKLVDGLNTAIFQRTLMHDEKGCIFPWVYGFFFKSGSYRISLTAIDIDTLYSIENGYFVFEDLKAASGYSANSVINLRKKSIKEKLAPSGLVKIGIGELSLTELAKCGEYIAIPKKIEKESKEYND